MPRMQILSEFRRKSNLFSLRHHRVSLDLSDMWKCWLWKVECLRSSIDCLGTSMSMLANTSKKRITHTLWNFKHPEFGTMLVMGEHCCSCVLIFFSYVHRLVQNKADGKLVELRATDNDDTSSPW